MAESKTMSLKGKIKAESYSDGEEDDKGQLDSGLCLSKLNIGPKKKLLVLCSGGFLYHRIYRYEILGLPKNRSTYEAKSYAKMLVYPRPYCEDFIKFCLERFEVGIWSSSTKFNIDNSLNCILKRLKSQLAFVWGQEKSTDTGFESLEKKNKPLTIKELKKVWECNATLPRSRGQFSPSNTLLIDHQPYKAILNPAYNAIFVEKYDVDDTEDNVLGPKSDLRRYLDELVDAKDVPGFVEDNPFGEMAINPKHPDWKFYSKIIAKYQKSTIKTESDD